MAKQTFSILSLTSQEKLNAELFEAVRFKGPAEVQDLIAKGADVNTQKGKK